MIDPLELRINNLVTYKGENRFVIGISETGVIDLLKQDRSGVETVRNIEPIKISELLLKEALFLPINVESTMYERKFGSEIEPHSLRISLKTGIVMFCDLNPFSENRIMILYKPLEFFHQLQNLFYILSGVEL